MNRAEQKKLDVLEHLVAFIARNCGRMTPEQVSEECRFHFSPFFDSGLTQQSNPQ